MNSFCFLEFNTKSNKCQFGIYKEFKIQRKNFINNIFILAKFNKNFKQKIVKFQLKTKHFDKYSKEFKIQQKNVINKSIYCK